MADSGTEFDQIPFGTDDFADNPEPRCPLLLLLDTSGSMSGRPISELNDGVMALKEELTGDSLASKRVEIAIVTFGPVDTVFDFTTVNNFFPPQLKSRGDTPMGAAINQGLDLLETRKSILNFPRFSGKEDKPLTLSRRR